MTLKNRMLIVAKAQLVEGEALPKDLATAAIDFWDWCVVPVGGKPEWLCEYEENQKSAAEANRGWILAPGPDWASVEWHAWALLASRAPLPADPSVRYLWQSVILSHGGFGETLAGPRVFDAFMTQLRQSENYQESFITFEREPLKEPEP